MAGVGANTALRDADVLSAELRKAEQDVSQIVNAIAQYERRLVPKG